MTNLSNNPELAEEYLCSDLFNVIILYSGDQISRDGLTTILNYYRGLIDDVLRDRLVHLVDVLPENTADPNHPFNSAEVNQQIKSLLRNIQAVFEEYYDNLSYESGTNHEVTIEAQFDAQSPRYIKRFNDLLETVFEAAKDFAQQGIHFIRENPKAIVTATASATAIGTAYYFARGGNFNTHFPFDDTAMPSPWGYFAPSMSQTSQVLFDVTVVYGLSVASGYPQLAAPGALMTSLVSLWNGAWAAAPTLINPIPDQIAYVGIPFNLTFRADYVFHDTDNDTLSITVKLSDGSPLPAWLQLGISPFRLGFYDTPGSAGRVSVSDGIAYVADDIPGLQIIDVNNPAAPFRLGFYDTPGYARGVSVSGDTVYVADYEFGLQIINVSNPAAPFRLGFYDTPGYAVGVCVSGGTAFVADEGPSIDKGLQIIDVSNPTAPFRLGFYNTSGGAVDVSISGSTAFVADKGPGIDSGLQIIDVGNLSAPFRLGHYDTQGRPSGVRVSGSTAFIADMGTGLQIIDVSNLSAPFWLGSYEPPGVVENIRISGTMAFMAYFDLGLQVIDVSNPAAPFRLGFYDALEAMDVSVSGSTAFVANSTTGLEIIDIGKWVLNGTPPVSGIYTLNVTANDGHGGQVTDQFRINVGPVSGTSQSSRNPSSSGIVNSCAATVVSNTGLHSMTTSLVTQVSVSSTRSALSDRQTAVSTSADSTLSDINTRLQQTTIMVMTSEKEPGSNTVLILAIVIGATCGAGIITLPAVYLFWRKRQDTEKPRPGSITELSRSDAWNDQQGDGFRMTPVVKDRRKEVGDQYYILSKINQGEADEIRLRTGLTIDVPEGKERVKYIVGRGNYGAIKIAQRIADREYVISKKVSGASAIAESKAEAYIQKEAAGANVLPIYNTIELKNVLYHFMPLAGFGNGRAMQALLACADHRVKMYALSFVARDILTGLKTCHTKGIYHLDIKPENIVFTKDGTGYITDFGCAKRAPQDNPSLSHCLGDNRYFSPERYQASREDSVFRADKADAWAAGLTLLELAFNMNLSQLLKFPMGARDRFLRCDEDFFNKQLKRIPELQYPEEGSICAVIKGLLEPNVEKRLIIADALNFACFKSVDPLQKEPFFTEIRSRGMAQPSDVTSSPTVAPQVYSHDAHREYYEPNPIHGTDSGQEYGSPQYFADRNREAAAAPSHGTYSGHMYGSPQFFADRNQEATRASQSMEYVEEPSLTYSN